MATLDALPAWVRHLAIIVGTVVLTAISQAVASKQFDAASIAYAIGAGLIAQLLLWLTPLTKQYGVGSPPAVGEPVITTDTTTTITPDQPPGD